MVPKLSLPEKLEPGKSRFFPLRNLEIDHMPTTVVEIMKTSDY